MCTGHRLADDSSKHPSALPLTLGTRLARPPTPSPPPLASPAPRHSRSSEKLWLAAGRAQAVPLWGLGIPVDVGGPIQP